MSLDSLRVLHIKSYNNQHKETNPLAEFKKTLNPFSPSTCARHVYIMTSQTSFEVKNLMNYLKDHSDHCELLQGTDAYEFVLRWAVGAESHKLQSNDHFVLGAIRDAWNYYQAANTVIDLEMTKIMQIMLEDARHIRDTIQNLEVSSDAFKELLVRMCHNCTLSRQSQQRPAYKSMLSEYEDYISSAQSAFFKKKTQGLSRSMSALNAKMEVNSIKPSSIDKPEPQIRMFRTNLSYALEKHALVAKSLNTQTTMDILTTPVLTTPTTLSIRKNQ